MLGFKKLEAKNEEAVEPTESEKLEVTQSLYKQNLELAIKNKTLSLLRQLYQISILALQAKPLAEKIVNLIRETLEFEMVSIYNIDELKRAKPLAISRSERLENLTSNILNSFQAYSVDDAETRSFFKPLFEKKANHTDEIETVWKGIIPSEELNTIIQSGHIKTISAYPLVTDNVVRGILLICLNRPYETLSTFEVETIDSVVDVTAIAVDRARLYEELQNANKQQVVLIHFITHQVKGFLTKSRNIFAMAVEGEYGKLPEAFIPMAQEGLRSDTQGVTTVQEILNASNVKSGSVTYTMVPFDIIQLINEVIAGLKANADKKNLALSFEPDPSIHEFVGDKLQLQNAIKNLIDNSIKYTPSGSVSLKLSKEGEKLRLTIQDTGVGITPEDMVHLFTEGGHGKDSIKVNVDSTGFGLYIVKNIIEAHHGKVWVESEGAGKGSTFIVELPTNLEVTAMPVGS